MKQKLAKIKVCQVVTVDMSLRFLLYEQMKHLQREGFEVYAVSSPGKWIPNIKEAGIRVITIHITRSLFTPLRDLKALIRLISLFRKEKFDIVHTHTLKASFLGQIAAFLTRVPIRVYTMHGLFFQKDSSWRRKTVFMLTEVIISKLAHSVFFVNREDIETVGKIRWYDGSKVKYFGGGIDLRRFDPSRFSEQFVVEKKRLLQVPLDVKVIGITARLVVEKGYLDLFKAFSIVRRQYPQTFLLIVGPEEPKKGDGLQQEIVKKYGIEKHTLFLGERQDVEEICMAMDIFVLPSYREGLGISILEASAMKRPIIASDIRGCREAVDNEKTGLLVPVRNPEKLADAIMYLLSNPEKAKELGRAGRRKIEREFDENMVFARMTNEYARLIKEKLQ